MINKDDALDLERAAAFKKFMANQAKIRPGQVLTADSEAVLDVPAIPTGAVSLDVAIGVGGVPRGRIVELYGLEGSGKTSLALSIAANDQKLGGNIMFIDAEQAIDSARARSLGVDLSRLVIFQPNFAEEAFQVALDALASGGFTLVIVDSIAAMAPLKETESQLEEQQMGLMPRIISKFLRQAPVLANKSGATLICINQVREKIGTMMGNPETTPGGHALKHASSLRMRVSSNPSEASKLKDSSGNIIGQLCSVKIIKNKVGPPYKSAEYELMYQGGIRQEHAMLPIALQLGIITKPSPNSPIHIEAATGTQIGRSKDSTIETMKNDPELMKRLLTAVYAVITANKLPPAEIVEEDQLDPYGLTKITDDDLDMADVDVEMGELTDEELRTPVS